MICQNIHLKERLLTRKARISPCKCHLWGSLNRSYDSKIKRWYFRKKEVIEKKVLIKLEHFVVGSYEEPLHHEVVLMEIEVSPCSLQGPIKIPHLNILESMVKEFMPYASVAQFVVVFVLFVSHM